ncbi:MAG TPA: DUF4019 domain-containing protein [Gammaproteobacteria bacterium]|nr:DUF4019 domain-containing protein [Gammaproteobacteria bacterium]
MKSKLLITVIPALLIVASSAQADQAASIGYSSVKEALDSLKKKPGVEISDRNGWTIITEKGAKELVVWSFAPRSDPAYPAVAKRNVYEKDGGIYVDLNILCHAPRPDCDNFQAQFKWLNEQMTQGMQAAPQTDSAPQTKQWEPDAKQIAAAKDLARQYLKLLDEGRYQEAYELLAPGMQKLMSFKEWSKHSADFRLESGGDPVHEIARLSWHKDPPGAAYPGVYAAFDLNCRYTNINFCTETLILHQQDTGEFRVMRHEQNVVDKDAEKKILEDSMKKNAL